MNKYILYTNTKEIHGESIDNDKIFNHEIGNFLESYEMNADVYDGMLTCTTNLTILNLPWMHSMKSMLNVVFFLAIHVFHTLPLHLSTKLMKTATLLTVMQ